MAIPNKLLILHIEAAIIKSRFILTQMKHNVFWFFIATFLLVCCTNQRTTKDATFHNVIVLKTTPVKNQGKSPLCWTYAMLATIESEHLMMGDSVNLSPDWLARLWLEQQARTYYLTRGREKVSGRGMATMTLRLMDEYGIEPYDNYYQSQDINYSVLCRTAMQVAKASTSLDMLNNRLGDILDKQMGYLPPNLFMLGMAYTPQQFAESVCLPGEWQAVTSFTHHPFGERYILESPDNKMQDYFLNIPIENLMHEMVQSIKNGHPVCWEGDISEPGFNWEEGVATLSDESKSVTQEDRQRAYERFKTTDDHCMELCGIARDNSGKTFFIAKNSWGKSNKYRGFMYLSYNYVKLKTIAAIIHKH